MIANVEYVKERYVHFNEVCFEGALPEVPIVLSKAKTFLGKLEYESVRGLFGRVVSTRGFRIKISTLYDLPEEELEDVIIHEMIHLYIASRRIKDTSSHGNVFREMMARINRQHGRHVTVSHPRSKALSQQVESASPETRYVCISTFRDGRRGVTVCIEKRVGQMMKDLMRYYDLTGVAAYKSGDPFFARFPKSHKPRIFKVKEKELDEHIIDAQIYNIK